MRKQKKIPLYLISIMVEPLHSNYYVECAAELPFPMPGVAVMTGVIPSFSEHDKFGTWLFRSSKHGEYLKDTIELVIAQLGVNMRGCWDKIPQLAAYVYPGFRVLSELEAVARKLCRLKPTQCTRLYNVDRNVWHDHYCCLCSRKVTNDSQHV